MKTFIVISSLFLFIFLPIVIFSYRHVFTLKRILAVMIVIAGLISSYFGYYYIQSMFEKKSTATLFVSATPETCPEGFKTFPETDKITKFDNLTLDVSCGGRWGPCPNYMVTIKENGEATYEGLQNVLVEGKSKIALTAEQLAALIEELNKSSFFSLPERWSEKPGCCPSCGNFDGNGYTIIISTTANGKEHRVVHQTPYRAPQQFTDFWKAIEKVVNITQWVGTDEERRKKFLEERKKAKKIEPLDPAILLPDAIPSP